MNTQLNQQQIIETVTAAVIAAMTQNVAMPTPETVEPVTKMANEDAPSLVDNHEPTLEETHSFVGMKGKATYNVNVPTWEGHDLDTIIEHVNALNGRKGGDLATRQAHSSYPTSVDAFASMLGFDWWNLAKNGNGKTTMPLFRAIALYVALLEENPVRLTKAGKPYKNDTKALEDAYYDLVENTENGRVAMLIPVVRHMVNNGVVVTGEGAITGTARARLAIAYMLDLLNTNEAYSELCESVRDDFVKSAVVVAPGTKGKAKTTVKEHKEARPIAQKANTVLSDALSTTAPQVEPTEKPGKGLAAALYIETPVAQDGTLTDKQMAIYEKLRNRNENLASMAGTILPMIAKFQNEMATLTEAYELTQRQLRGNEQVTYGNLTTKEQYHGYWREMGLELMANIEREKAIKFGDDFRQVVASNMFGNGSYVKICKKYNRPVEPHALFPFTSADCKEAQRMKEIKVEWDLDAFYHPVKVGQVIR